MYATVQCTYNHTYYICHVTSVKLLLLFITTLVFRSWSDWVSCLHAKVGVPRWLTAATISLGIIFSLWLCLVIPSTAPKRKVKTVFIKGEKPSAAIAKAAEVAAKAKEAEAAGFNPGEYMVAVINVGDLPPTYGDVAVPASPAPSYKSDMASQAVPASPAPSYRSVEGEPGKKLHNQLNNFADFSYFSK